MTKTIICGRCNTPITLTKLVSMAYQKGQIKVICPKCQKPVIPNSKLPPTRDQLVFIQELGGSIAGIANREKAKKLINELINLKKRIENAKTKKNVNY